MGVARAAQHEAIDVANTTEFGKMVDFMLKPVSEDGGVKERKQRLNFGGLDSVNKLGKYFGGGLTEMSVRRLATSYSCKTLQEQQKY